MKISVEDRAFYLAEYQALRAEVLISLTEVRALERYLPLACAALWSWIFTHPETFWVVAGMSPVLTVLGGVRAFTYHLDFERMHDYIGRLEKAILADLTEEPELSSEVPLGWEKFSEHSTKYATSTAIVFWVVLLVANIGAVILFSRHMHR